MTSRISPACTFDRAVVVALSCPKQLRRWHAIAVHRLEDMERIVRWPTAALESFRADVDAVEQRMADLGLEVPA